MRGNSPVLVSLCLGVALLASGCDEGDTATSYAVLNGEGDADGTTGAEGDGDGDDEDFGDGDGDGDGEAEPSSTAPNEACDVPSPYMGGWDIGCCQADAVSTGWSAGGVGQGSVIPDWTFTDQYGDAVRVRDFCHEAIYFEYSAMWCGSCQSHAPEVANLFNTYDSRGLMTLTYMSESADSGPATQADVVAWSDTYGQNGLVVYSGLQDVWYPFGVDSGGGSFSISLPGTMLVGTNGKIAKLGIPTIQEIELVIPGK